MVLDIIGQQKDKLEKESAQAYSVGMRRKSMRLDTMANLLDGFVDFSVALTSVLLVAGIINSVIKLMKKKGN